MQHPIPGQSAAASRQIKPPANSRSANPNSGPLRPPILVNGVANGITEQTSRNPTQSRKRAHSDNEREEPRSQHLAIASQTNSTNNKYYAPNRISKPPRNKLGTDMEVVDGNDNNTSSSPSSSTTATSIEKTTSHSNSNPKRQKLENANSIFQPLDASNPEIQNRIKKRQIQVSYGKNTLGYDNYISQIPKTKREITMPRTPDASLDIPTKRWAGLIKAWRVQLHKYDPKEEGEGKTKEEPIQEEVIPDYGECRVEDVEGGSYPNEFEQQPKETNNGLVDDEDLYAKLGVMDNITPTNKVVPYAQLVGKENEDKAEREKMVEEHQTPAETVVTGSSSTVQIQQPIVQQKKEPRRWADMSSSEEDNDDDDDDDDDLL